MKRRSFLLLAAATAASSTFAGRLSLSASRFPADDDRLEPDELVHHDTWIMGQIARIWIQGVPEARAHEAINAAFASMRALERTLSRFDASSELSAFLDSPAGRPVLVSSALAEAVRLAGELSAGTDGAFDPTFAPGRPAPGMGRLRLNGNRLTRPSEECRLDFGGSGCGMALDRAALELRRHGARRALLELSGDFLALAAPTGIDGWPLEIADPWTGDPSGLRIDLRHAALAVSSAVEPGRIIDPRDGCPASAHAQAAVLAPTALEADAFSTAAVVRDRLPAVAENRTSPGGDAPPFAPMDDRLVAGRSEAPPRGRLDSKLPGADARPLAGIRVLRHRWDGSAG